jgi:hypothetical protein
VLVIRSVARAWLASIVSVLLLPSPAMGQAAPPEAAEQHVHDPGGASGQAPLCPICPASRAAAGTSWQPDATQVTHHWRAAGAWQYAVHLDVALATVREGGPRGDEGTFSPNFAMVNVRRPLGAGVFGVQSMWSLEPAMGPEGYPLLLQTGETANGVTALVDRQHPHDLPMELAATYTRPVGVDRAFFVYAAAVGAPAIGPPPFMHRASGALLPVAPITHHWFDSTHLTYGVLTGGFVVSPKAKLEGSLFRGREPNQDRWGFEAPALDSYAVRVSVNPTTQLSVQVSAAMLADAEQLHPGADVSRLTASAMYSSAWRGLTVDGLLTWGRNKRSPSTVPIEGGLYFYPGVVAHAVLGEATVARGRHAAVTRIERAIKDELFPLPDARHSMTFPVSRFTAGYAFRVLETRYVAAQIGGAAAWSRVADELEAVYGGHPRSGLFFARIVLH